MWSLWRRLILGGQGAIWKRIEVGAAAAVFKSKLLVRRQVEVGKGVLKEWVGAAHGREG